MCQPALAGHTNVTFTRINSKLTGTFLAGQRFKCKQLVPQLSLPNSRIITKQWVTFGTRILTTSNLSTGNKLILWGTVTICSHTVDHYVLNYTHKRY